MIERIITSAVIVLTPQLFRLSGLLIVGFYIILGSGLLFMYSRTQCALLQEEKKGLFSYIYRNYTLRQVINFIFGIMIQVVLCCSQGQMNSIETTEDVLNTSESTGKIAPTMFLVLIIMSMVVTVFFWVWQLINSSMITKGNQLFRILCSIPSAEESNPLGKQIV